MVTYVYVRTCMHWVMPPSSKGSFVCRFISRELPTNSQFRFFSPTDISGSYSVFSMGYTYANVRTYTSSLYIICTEWLTGELQRIATSLHLIPGSCYTREKSANERERDSNRLFYFFREVLFVFWKPQKNLLFIVINTNTTSFVFSIPFPSSLLMGHPSSYRCTSRHLLSIFGLN